MPDEPPDPLAEVHRLLDQQQARTVWRALPPLIFGGATFGALVAELPELALTLGVATLLSGVVAGLTAWERLRKIRAVRAILKPARRETDDPGEG